MNSELRASRSMGVDLLIPGQPTRRATLRSLSREGVWLARTGLPGGVRIGTRLQLGLCIPDANPREDISDRQEPQSRNGYFRVTALLTSLDSQGAEARFLDPSPALTRALAIYQEACDAEAQRAEARERQQTALRQRIDATSRNAVGAEAVALVRGLLEDIVAGLAKQAEHAGSDLQRVRARDDAARLRHACRQGLPLRLAGELLKLGHDRSRSRPAPTLLDDERTTLWLARRELVERLEARLTIPLQQLTYRLNELEAQDPSPPYTPAALAKALEQSLTGLDLSIEGRLYGLRSAGDLTESLVTLYHQLLVAWERL